MAKRFAAAIMMCAVMVLVAAVPLAMADSHLVTKGVKGPRNSAITWEYVPPGYGTWTGEITNDGLRWLVVDVYDTTDGLMEQKMHQRIRFAAYDAYPAGLVVTNGVTMNPTHTYSITVIPNGPRDTTCTVVDLFDLVIPPVPRFTAVVTHMDVAVDASASTDDGTIVTYSWSFGDGGVAAGEKATHTYKLPGIYTITLDLLDDDGLTATLSQDVEIIDYPPVADFTFTVDGATVSFLSASTDDYGIVSYSWDFGDGTTSTEANPTHTYSTEPVPPGLALTEMSGKARTPQMWYGMIGYCFGTSGNPLAGVAVTVTNTITGEWETQVTAADGYYSVDISNNNPNFPTGYAEGDIISVVAVLGSVTDSGSGVVDTNAAVYTWIDFTLDSGPVAHDYMVKLTVTDELGQKSTIGKLVTVYW